LHLGSERSWRRARLRRSNRRESIRSTQARHTAPIARIITVWLTSSATLLLLGALLPGVAIAGFGTALAVAAILGLLNGIVWPLVLRFALPLTVLTLGPRRRAPQRRHALRTDGFAHCPDIVLNSTYCAESEEVAAFEQLVGSHGGLGGRQSFPFLLHPVELELPTDEHVVGAEAVHRHLRRWLVFVGQREYADRRSLARAAVAGADGRDPRGASPAQDIEAQAR